MGGGRFSQDSWQDTSLQRRSMSREQMFSKGAQTEYLSQNIKVRESVDSVDNPNSTPIAIFMDVTGSMGHIPQYMATTGIGLIMSTILKHQPVSDPHVLLGTFADCKGRDTYPLQVAQFEADNRVAEQATNFHLGGGGAQDSESYDLPWYFAAHFTKTDSWDKRGKKGYLFTMGDEPFPDRSYTKEELSREFSGVTRGWTAHEMLQAAKERWIPFHIVIEDGARGRDRQTQRTWQEAMGANCLFLNDYTKLAHLITATIAAAEGASMDEVLEMAGEGRAAVEYAFNRVNELTK